MKKSIPAAIRLACAQGPVSYRDYIELALYDPDTGYYTRDEARVGREPNCDFYTAESLGAVFAQLISTAAEDLLGPEQAAQSTFVEIAAEPGQELLSHLKSHHRFAASKVIRQGQAIEVEGPAIVFANEWLDALPFHRLIYRNQQWHERGVELSPDDELKEVLLPEMSDPVAAISDRLPTEDIEEGYELDLPLDAERALRDLVTQDWQGLLLLFDYGKTWQVLSEEMPRGSARTYYQHKIGGDLLARPGQEDITCHVCWDPLEAILGENRFQSITLETQENFIVHRASRAASTIVSETAGSFSPNRQTLMELMHPAHMGRRFQVLWGLRQP